jgi:hypothetical protein
MVAEQRQRFGAVHLDAGPSEDLERGGDDPIRRVSAKQVQRGGASTPGRLMHSPAEFAPQAGEDPPPPF